MASSAPNESSRIASETCGMSADILSEVARPLRLTPQKRASDEVQSLETSPAKCSKRLWSCEFQPQPKQVQGLESSQKKMKKVPELADFNEVVKRAISFYKDLWTLQTVEEECGYPQDEEARDDRSGLACEEWAIQHYEAIRDVANALLPWAGGLEPVSGADYDVLRFHGSTPSSSKKKSCKTADDDDRKEHEQIREFRNSGKQAQAREALVTLCSALSCRKEKLWVEFSECDLPDLIKKSGLRRVKSAKMLGLIKDHINDLVKKGEWYCQFATALLRSESYIRLAFGRGMGCSIPASILIVHRMPLWKVFEKMEEDAPFCGAAKEKGWWKSNQRELGFHELNFACEDPEARNWRLPISSVKPDTQMKKLLRSETPVVYLDILAALSTREASKKYGLSSIVKGELAMLFREAKANGEAVIFVLGSEDPKKLAEKVYLRPPLNEWGLKCGCFRWRASAKDSWSREKEYSDRSTFMLQMP